MLRVSPLGARVGLVDVAVGEEGEVTCGSTTTPPRATPPSSAPPSVATPTASPHGHLPLDGARSPARDPGHRAHAARRPGRFDRRTWEEVAEFRADRVVLTLDSPNSDQGSPAAVRATMRYDVTADGVVVALDRDNDAPTVVALTNHKLSLGAPGDGDVHDHRLQVAAHQFPTIDSELIPTGLADVRHAVRPARCDPVAGRGDRRPPAARQWSRPQLCAGRQHPSGPADLTTW